MDALAIDCIAKKNAHYGLNLKIQITDEFTDEIVVF